MRVALVQADRLGAEQLAEPVVGLARRDRRLGPELDDERVRATAGSPSTRSARRAASAPASRSSSGRGDVHAASSPTRRAASASRSSGTAAPTAARTPSTCSGVRAAPRQSASAPAASARTAECSTPSGPPAPCISSASVITTPSKPSSVRSSSTTAEFQVAGASPKAPKRMCAVITARTPASIAAANGGSARSRRTSRPASEDGSSRCESATVSPWPGKCLAQAATPTLCRPSTKAATWRATTCGSEPNERTPTIALAGSTSTSATGARSRSIPTAASSPPIAAPTRRVRAGSSTAPSAKFPGNELPLAGLEPRHVAALLVGRDDQLRPLGPQRGRQLGHLLRVRDVLPVEDDAAEPVGQQALQPVGDGLAVEPREEAGRRVAQPRTAPAVRPKPIFRCTIRKKTITGIAISVEPAIRPPQSVFRLVP